MLELWADFFEELQAISGRSQNTVMAYRRDLEVYEEFLASKKPIGQIYDFLTKKGLSPRSQARVISSLRTYMKFCEKNGKKCPELRELRQPKSPKTLPKVLGTDQFYELQKAAITDNELQTRRNQLVLSLLFGSGCRVSEMISLDSTDYNALEQWIKVTGKGGKERLIPLANYLSQALNQYLESIRPHLLKEKSDTLIVNDRGRRPSRVDIWRWLSAWSEKAGFEQSVSPHQLRHGCATSLLDSGADLRSIQLLLGHSSIQTTQIYTSVSHQHLHDAIKKYHPLTEASVKDSSKGDGRPTVDSFPGETPSPTTEG